MKANTLYICVLIPFRIWYLPYLRYLPVSFILDQYMYNWFYLASFEIKSEKEEKVDQWKSGSFLVARGISWLETWLRRT